VVIIALATDFWDERLVDVLENFELAFGSMLQNLSSIYLSEDDARIVVMSNFVFIGFNKKMRQVSVSFKKYEEVQLRLVVSATFSFQYRS